MLRACRRLLRPGGRLAFFSIFVAPDLPPAQHRLAAGAGPDATVGPPIAGLLERARFTDVVERDLTEEYAASARAWLAARLRHRAELRPLDPESYDQRIGRNRGAIPVIEQGLLRRALYLARR